MTNASQFETVIGLEVHAQLKTLTKIFCGCSTAFGAPPNTHICPVCLGMPGVLPVLNKKVVAYAIKMAIATECRIERVSRFARKNYFYPDLPKNYQISQYELPIAQFGHVNIDVDGTIHRIGITRIHMEEDAGKLVHNPDRPVSHVDYNRTGVPLIEIVSEPDLRTPEEAGAYLRHLRAIVRYMDICDGNLEEGSFRCDANVSIRPQGSDQLGTRAELKNLNSFKHVEKALYYEIARQQDLVMDGGQVIQETRLWDPDRGRTFSMRGKEEAHDYRYFPDPDLLPLVIEDPWIEELRATIPELPEEKKQRFVETYGLPDQDATLLTGARDLADYFETCARAVTNPKLASNWITGTLLAFLNAQNLSIAQSPLSPADLAELLTLIEAGTISGKIAKTVFDEMTTSNTSAAEIVKAKGLTQVSDSNALEEAVQKVLDDNPDEVAAFKGGKTKLMGFFVGQVMRATRGRANPQMVNQIIADKLN